MESHDQSPKWWQNAIIYQVYPLTFHAPDGQYGTLQGVTEKMDHIQSLGVDAIWLSPFFKSPLAEGFGYNVTDYRDIAPELGSMGDTEAMIATAHDKGMKVIFDLVVNHTSDKHPWFEASRNPNHPDHLKYKDFYVWADPTSGEGDPSLRPPSNWKEIIPPFDESAWTWEPERQQFYLHNFVDSMPDLNLRNPELVKECQDIVRFWLDKGVDGFRMDAIPFFLHDESLADADLENPDFDARYARQRGLPETTDVLRQLREVEKDYNRDIFWVGEVFAGAPSSAYGALYTQPGANDQAYTALLAGSPFTADDWPAALQTLAPEKTNFANSNHDMARAISRWNLEKGGDAAAKMIAALTLSLPGSICLFQGEELGLPDAPISDIRRDLLHFSNLEAHRDYDPINIAKNLGDGETCRSMMPWSMDTVKRNDGWVGMPANYKKYTAEAQEQNPDSVLNFYRAFIQMRKTQPALLHGDIRMLDDTPDGICAFTRSSPEQNILCAFNGTAKAQTLTLPLELALEYQTSTITLPPYGMALHDAKGPLALPDEITHSKNFALVETQPDHSAGEKLRILIASAEISPFSKAGGLGEATKGLTEGLAALGHEVLVISPWYQTNHNAFKPEWIGDVSVPFDGEYANASVGCAERNGVKYAFVGYEPYFGRDKLYGHDDDSKRFALLNRAVPEVAAKLGFTPDVIHANDWHTGYIPAILHESSAALLPDGFADIPTVASIHNAPYQGQAGLKDAIHWLRLPGDLTNRDGIRHHGDANPLQANINYADAVITVSPGYANELRTQPEFQAGLDIHSNEHKLIGITNGIDIVTYNPANDSLIPSPFDAQDLSGKQDAKTRLCQTVGLTEPERPIASILSRFTHQKGVDIIAQSMDEMIAQGWNLVLAGGGDPDLTAMMQQAAKHHPGRIIIIPQFVGAEMEHLIYAGSDTTLLPSRYEPCGQNQMLGQRYGTLPIARRTGGLQDTVEHGKNGFVFDELTPEAFQTACREAISLYGTPAWQKMQQTAMQQDNSWAHAAKQYESIYYLLHEARQAKQSDHHPGHDSLREIQDGLKKQTQIA
jgi:alpha-glucosidase